MSSLENRGNGSWRLTISDGYAPDGKKIRFQRTIHVDPMHTPAVQRREAEKQAAHPRRCRPFQKHKKRASIS